MALSTIQIDTQANPDCAIIWLHGLGANGQDFVPIVEDLSLPKTLSARFIFPHAPIQAVTLNNGVEMPSWYDIFGLDRNSNEDHAGIQAISDEIYVLISQQVDAGILAKRIVLAGFSQGGALALFAGLSTSHQLAGLLGMSCYLPHRNELNSYSALADRSLPIFLAHGLYDEVVSIEFAQHARELLEQQNFKISWNEYPCSHTVCPQEIVDIRDWLLNRWQ